MQMKENEWLKGGGTAPPGKGSSLWRGRRADIGERVGLGTRESGKEGVPGSNNCR